MSQWVAEFKQSIKQFPTQADFAVQQSAIQALEGKLHAVQTDLSLQLYPMLLLCYASLGFCFFFSTEFRFLIVDILDFF